jgi:glutathione S-transferase
MSTEAAYTLYGSAASLYTGKVRAYLRYKGIPYTEVEASEEDMRDIILPRTGVQYIPVVISPDDLAIQDSTDIINFLEARFPESAIYPSSPRQRLVAQLFELYGDEWLVIPAMHYRWHHNFDETVREWGALMAPELSAEEQWQLAKPGVEYFRGMCPPLGITDDTIPAIEAWYEEFLGFLDRHFQQHDYLLGSRPSIGDYGLMGPLYAHLYRDPVSGALMKRLAPHVAGWVERMNDPEVLAGEFLADDEVPATLYPILQRLFAEYFPVIQDTVERLAVWLDIHPDEEIPRNIGSHAFTIGGIAGERDVSPFAQWMLQHGLFFYQSLKGDDKASVDELLDKVGGYPSMQIQLRHRVARENNRLVRVAGNER